MGYRVGVIFEKLSIFCHFQGSLRTLKDFKECMRGEYVVFIIFLNFDIEFSNLLYEGGLIIIYHRQHEHALHPCLY